MAVLCSLALFQNCFPNFENFLSPSNISSRMIYCILSKNVAFLHYCEQYEPLCEKPKKSRVQMTLDIFGMKKVFLQIEPSHDFSICYFLLMSFGIYHKRTE